MPSTLLILEDDEAIRHALARFFALRGHMVDAAGDFGHAATLVRGREYAALLADLRLSGTNSTEGLELIRLAKERSPATRCVLLTAYASDGVNATAREWGAFTVLRKPVDLQSIARVLEAAPHETPTGEVQRQ